MPLPTYTAPPPVPTPCAMLPTNVLPSSCAKAEMIIAPPVKRAVLSANVQSQNEAPSAPLFVNTAPPPEVGPLAVLPTKILPCSCASEDNTTAPPPLNAVLFMKVQFESEGPFPPIPVLTYTAPAPEPRPCAVLATKMLPSSIASDPNHTAPPPLFTVFFVKLQLKSNTDPTVIPPSTYTAPPPAEKLCAVLPTNVQPCSWADDPNHTAPPALTAMLFVKVQSKSNGPSP
mmetsp:Transcript_8132/g.19342  ORF Transcript_8132/g.19342 Transcript_8132/m.19342 type:complete len:230 (-) Transcript_8132:287-976(-)